VSDARRLIRDALVAVVGEKGYKATELSDVLQRAGADADEFHRHWPDLEDCFFEIWQGYKQAFFDVTREGFASADNWRDGMRAAAWRFGRFLQEDEVRARLFLIEFNYAGERVRASRDVVMAQYAELIHRGNEIKPPDLPPVPHTQAEALIGAIWEGAVSRVLTGKFDEFPELIPGAMYITVLPYLGVEAAAEELQRGPADIERYRRGEI
jgi:AcrR family transcriptional regulator